MMDAELVGQLHLRQARSLPQFGEPQSQERTVFLAQGEGVSPTI